MERRCMVLSASMGAGHDAVAAELARRLEAAGHDVLVHDVLTLLPCGAGPATRAFYRFTVRHAPWLYELIYAVFLAPGPDTGRGAESGTGAKPGRGPGRRRGLDVSPMAALAERRLLALVDRWRPDVIVSTFHLAGQITGRLRRRGRLRVPCAVFITDFALHRGWLEPGNDLFLCVTETAAGTAGAVTGRRAVAPGPVVPPAFHGASPSPGAFAGAPARADEGRPPVLLSAGAWGVGDELLGTAGALAAHGFLPVLLCGRDERLRRRAARLPGVLALGWVDDMPGLMAAARVLVDNAAGQTSVQALAARLPVIGYRPIPGHGAVGVREMAAEGLTEYAYDLGDLLARAARLVRPGPGRDRRTELGAAVFRDDAARLVAELAEAGARLGSLSEPQAGQPGT
ncbi:galactosyldiacylglycerol synthase [Streptomyces sp. NPDC006368]|uniref:MGDG synthase family glycosyltransferase n=1 Tax=Streptomyces sp. NPDC006368 TaxID=3156760 RepID=UPI0033AC462E